jgi:uncharacterized protein (DUF2235 family)
VGDSNNQLVKLLGGAFGAGIITRIARGYTFVSRNYDPGDAIYLIGFSRGAYTARALAGMIAAQGLLDRTKVDSRDGVESYRAASAAWEQYRRPRIPVSWASAHDDTMRDMPGFVQENVAEMLTGPVRVHTVGVWDTVGALGIPLYDNRDRRIDAFQFCDTKLNERVDKAFHAVSIDEMRSDFRPTLWDTRQGITQMLFPGAHADVGGGYPMVGGESDLAHLALEWMHDQLAADGVRMKGAYPAQYKGSAAGGSHQPWLNAPWTSRKPAWRELQDWAQRSMSLHPSIDQRKALAGGVRLYPGAGTQPYAPGSID